MTKKHFKAIAEIISIVRKEYTDNERRGVIADISIKLADYFENENPNFDRVRFFTALEQNG
jgi:predicted metal-dependent hydrolase